MSDTIHLKLNREEIAKQEIGVTQISRRLSFIISIYFLCCIFCYPVLQIGYEYISLHEKVPQSFEIFYPSRTTSWKRILTSNNRLIDYIHSSEGALNDGSLLHKYLLPPLHIILLKYFNLGNESVTVGKDQWLFYKRDMDYLTAPESNYPSFYVRKKIILSPKTQDPIDTITEFNRYLSNLGIKLIIFTVPVKSALYPDKYPNFPQGINLPLHGTFFEPIKSKLSQNGISFFSLDSVFANAKQKGILLYTKTDSHWTPNGLLLATHELSKFIQSSVPLLPPNPATYTTSIQSSVFVGDILYISSLLQLYSYMQRDHVTLRQIYKDGLPIKNDHNSDILLMGDSFLNAYSNNTGGRGIDAGLMENLSYELHRPIELIAIDGDQGYKVRQQLATHIKEDKNYLKGKKVVVWEFIEASLFWGDWRPIDFDKIKMESQEK